MSNDLMLDVGQANELKLAFRRAGYSNDEIKKLCEGSTLADVRSVLLGQAEIKIVDHVIDCNADPVLPNGWKVEEHQKTGSFKWDPKHVPFYLSKSQKKDSYIEGKKLRKELAGMRMLNANVLDYLLKNPQLIPEEWKRDEQGRIRYILFWGTIYRDSCGLCVRSLCCHVGQWDWDYSWLDRDWDGRSPAALRAS